MGDRGGGVVVSRAGKVFAVRREDGTGFDARSSTGGVRLVVEDGEGGALAIVLWGYDAGKNVMFTVDPWWATDVDGVPVARGTVPGGNVMGEDG